MELMEETSSHVLSARVLSQLLLMQNVLCNLPDEKSILSLVCRGLIDVPGVATVSCQDPDTETTNPLAVRFPLLASGSREREVVVTLSDPALFAPYKEYVSNFCFMVGVILEERYQRRLNEEHKVELEQCVAARTRQLNEEIAERRHAMEKLRATAQDLIRSNKDLKHFAYLAAHDLQEPLRTVRCFAQLIAKRYRNNLDPDLAEYMGFVVDGAGRMSDLVSGLLEYSHVSSAERTVAPLDCEIVLAEALSTLRPSIMSAGAEITHDPLPTVMGDQRQLTQLFANLVNNAIKFRSEGVVPRIRIGVREDEAHWLVSVRDNGIGIDPQYHKRVFEIFWRLHPYAEYKGTGIGLAICRRIVERHGGRIWIESPEEGGSIFCFTLPKQPRDRTLKKDRGGS